MVIGQVGLLFICNYWINTLQVTILNKATGDVRIKQLQGFVLFLLSKSNSKDHRSYSVLQGSVMIRKIMHLYIIGKSILL